jgi:hypothetical protein
MTNQDRFIHLNNTILNRDGKNIKVSFFENIFYWLWTYGKKIAYPGKRFYMSHPDNGAIIILVLLKLSNICSLLTIITGCFIFLNEHLFKIIIENNLILKITICLFIVLLIIDLRPYLSISKWLT